MILMSHTEYAYDAEYEALIRTRCRSISHNAVMAAMAAMAVNRRTDWHWTDNDGRIQDAIYNLLLQVRPAASIDKELDGVTVVADKQDSVNAALDRIEEALTKSDQVPVKRQRVA